MSYILVGVGVATAAYDIGSGIHKSNVAKRMAAANIRPWYNIPQEYQDNVNVAGSQAQTGLSPSSINYYSTQADRGLTTGTNAITEGGGDVDNLAKLYDSFSQGLSQESADDSNLKTGHVNTFLQANKDLAGQKTQQWALNYYEPYKDTAQLASAEKAAGSQQIGQGVNALDSAAASYSNANLYKSRTDAINKASLAGTAKNPASTWATSVDQSGFANSLNTPGGSAVMSNISKTDANSSQLQQLINLFSQPAPAY